MVSRDTIIIIAVCGAVAALIFLFLTTRLIRKVAATSNPLPPVQPLARHREQQLAKFDGTLPRSQTWYNTQNHLVAPQPFGSSRASLLVKNSSPVDTESATSCSPFAYELSLPLPSPSFHPARPGSSSSLGSSSEPGHPPPPASPPHTHGAPSPSPARRNRPLSMSSSHSTVYSKTSRNTLRGTPHGPHSQIQIILPAPLGPGDVTTGHSQQRMSRFDADRWVSPADENLPTVV